MSKEMRKYIDNFRNFEKSKLNEGFFDDIVSGAKSSWKRNVTGTYKEPVFIWIFTKNEQTTIQNNNLDSRVNIKIMDMLNDKFDLGFNKDKNGYYMSNVFKFDESKLNDVSNFLIDLGLERKDFETEGCLFKGKLSMKDLK
jgi:hypothetical protein